MNEPKPKPTLDKNRAAAIRKIQRNDGWFIIGDMVAGQIRTKSKQGLELAAQLPQDYDELMAVAMVAGFTFGNWVSSKVQPPPFYQRHVKHPEAGGRVVGRDEDEYWADPWLVPAAVLFAYLYDNDPFPMFS